MSIDASSFLDTGILPTAVDTFNALQASHPDLRIATLDLLLDSVSEDERVLVLGVCALDAAAYGVKFPRILTEEPADLVKIEPQPYVHDSHVKYLGPQYVTEQFGESFAEMNERMNRNLGHGLLMQSGYRSPAYQAITFLRELHKNDGDVGKTVRVVAPPFHSEHNDTQQLAADFMRPQFSGANTHFELTDQYQWLGENAEDHGFVLSYPESNDQGVAFEPWHWRHTGK